ncbi:ferredoxin family protein [Candidatus Latescibacterota bacterium]
MGCVIFVDEHLCKGVDGCGLCMHVCPKKVYEKSASLTKWGVKAPEPVRLENCNGCNLCMIYCPDMAIVVEKTETEKNPA